MHITVSSRTWPAHISIKQLTAFTGALPLAGLGFPLATAYKGTDSGLACALSPPPSPRR